MTTRQKVRLALFVVLGAFLLVALSDVLGLRESETSTRSPTGYVEISHGSHAHYVPNDWDGSDISSFPSTPPPQGMTVGADGRIVPLSE